MQNQPTPALGHGLPYLVLGGAPAHTRKLLDLLHLLGGQLHRIGDELVGLRKYQHLGLIDAHVLGGDALWRSGVDRNGYQPAHVQTHERLSRGTACVSLRRVLPRPETTCQASSAGIARPGTQCRALITGRISSPPA